MHHQMKNLRKWPFLGIVRCILGFTRGIDWSRFFFCTSWDAKKLATFLDRDWRSRSRVQMDSSSPMMPPYSTLAPPRPRIRPLPRPDVCDQLSALTLSPKMKKPPTPFGKAKKIDVYMTDLDMSYNIPETMTLGEMYATDMFKEDAASLGLTTDPDRALYAYRVKDGRETWVLPNVRRPLHQIYNAFCDSDGILCLRIGERSTYGVFKTC